MTIGMACWVALLKVLHVATVITQCDLMISVCSACYLIGCMIWSKAAARKTLYQFPDARCHLRHRGEVWMVPRWWGSAQWFGSSRAFFQTPTQNIFRTVTKQTSNKCIKTQAIWDLVFSAAIFKIWITFEMPPTQQRMNRMDKLKNKKSSNESSLLPFIGFILCKISPSRLAGNNHQQPGQQCSLFARPCSSNSGQVSTYGGVALGVVQIVSCMFHK